MNSCCFLKIYLFCQIPSLFTSAYGNVEIKLCFAVATFGVDVAAMSADYGFYDIKSKAGAVGIGAPGTVTFVKTLKNILEAFRVDLASRILYVEIKPAVFLGQGRS